MCYTTANSISYIFNKQKARKIITDFTSHQVHNSYIVTIKIYDEFIIPYWLHVVRE